MRCLAVAVLILSASTANVFGQTESPQQLFSRSMELFRQTKFEEMIDFCESTTEENRLVALANGLKALAYSELGDNDKAIETAKSAIEMKPKDAWQRSVLFSCLAFAQQRSGKHAEALESVEKAIEFADDAFPHYVRALAYCHRGENEESINAANECLERDPKHAMALMLRGVCQSNLSQTSSSLASMESAMKADPNYVGGAWIFAMDLALNGDVDRAITILDAAENVNNDAYTIFTARAFVHHMEADEDKRGACLEKAIELNDRHIEPVTALGYFFIQEKRFDEAEELAEQCLKRYPNHYQAYLMRGFLCTEQGEEDKAIKDYQRASKLNPTHFRPQLLEGLIYFRSEKYEKALTLFRGAKAKNPSYQTILIILGETYAYLGRHDEAVKEFSEVINTDQENGFAYLARAESYQALGKSKKAEADFEKASELGWEKEN